MHETCLPKLIELLLRKDPIELYMDGVAVYALHVLAVTSLQVTFNVK